MGIERREWLVTIGGREIQLWTRTTWMGGACRVSLGSVQVSVTTGIRWVEGNERENLD